MADVAAVPSNIAAIAVNVLVFVAQLRSLMLCSGVIAFSQILAQLPAVLRDFSLIAVDVPSIGATVRIVIANVAIISPVAVGCHQRAGAHQSHKNDSQYGAFHIYFSSFFLETRLAGELTGMNTGWGKSCDLAKCLSGR